MNFLQKVFENRQFTGNILKVDVTTKGLMTDYNKIALSNLDDGYKSHIISFIDEVKKCLMTKPKK